MKWNKERVERAICYSCDNPEDDWTDDAGHIDCQVRGCAYRNEMIARILDALKDVE